MQVEVRGFIGAKTHDAGWLPGPRACGARRAAWTTRRFAVSASMDPAAGPNLDQIWTKFGPNLDQI